MTLAKAEERLGTKSLLPQGWRWVRLGDICDMNPSRPAGFRRASDAPTTFVPMSAVDEHRGTILSAEIRPFSEVAKGYTFFSEGDILFAKITPCMQNGKQAIARGLIDGMGFGSTEFHVIRPRPGVVCEWIHRFVRQTQVLSAAVNHFTGAVGQQRVPESFLASLEIPLPSIDEQERIMHIVNEQMGTVQKAHAAAEMRLEAAEALPAAYLRVAFESEEAKGWQRVKCADFVDVRDGTHDTPEYVPNGIPLVTSKNLKPHGIDFDNILMISHEDYEQIKKRSGVDPGDILFAMIGTIGNPVIVDTEREFSIKNVALFKFDNSPLEAEFFYFVLQSPDIMEQIRVATQGGIQKFVSLAVLRNLYIPVPSVTEQRVFIAKLREKLSVTDILIQNNKEQLQSINALPAALLRRAFTGGL